MVQATLLHRSLVSSTVAAKEDLYRKVYIPLYSLLGEDQHSNGPDEESPSRRAKTVALAHDVFGQPIRRDIVHLCLTHYMDCQRQGSANTKTRYEVRGSRRKLHAQKGMGKARVGDAASPIRRGGGVAFGPRPRDFSSRLPRKMQHMGMRVLLSAKVREGRLMAVDSLEWSEPRTRSLAQRLDTLGWNDSRILFVTGRDAFQENFQRSCGNLQGTQSKTAVDVTVHDALKYSRVVADLPALEYFEERLRKGSTMPVPDSRKSITMRSLRQERRTAAIGKMAQLADKLVRLQYEGRFGESLPPIPLRLSSASEI